MVILILCALRTSVCSVLNVISTCDIKSAAGATIITFISAILASATTCYRGRRAVEETERRTECTI